MTETSNQITIKVQYKEDLRRFTFPRNAPFTDLEKILRNIFCFSPSFPLVVKYQDDEKDWVTCSSDAELAAAFDFLTPNAAILKLLIPSEPSEVSAQTVKPVVVASTVNVTPVEASNVNVTPVEPPRGDFVSRPPVGLVPWNPGCWKANKDNWRKEWKEEMKQWKDQKKNCREWTPEERAAWAQRRQAWKNRCKDEKDKMKDAQKDWHCQRKMWKQQKKVWKQSCPNADAAAPSCPRQEDLECRRGCPAKWRARFVKHVTVPDGTALSPGAAFTKTWCFRNESNEPWPLGSKILFVGKNSDQMGGPDELAVGRAVEPGQEVDVSVPLLAPSQPGSYCGFWRMADPSGKRFGQRVRVQIQVLGSDSSSSSSTEETEVVTPADRGVHLEKHAETVPLYPYVELFAQLEGMGFTDRALNLRLARKFDGDLVKIVKKLMKRQRKVMMAARR
jgi:hypothetical protein